MRNVYSLLVAALLLAPAALLQAGGHGHCTTGCCEVQCPQCNHTCKFSAKKDKEAKTCYDSECKPICIPKVVFPWQKKPACCGGCDSCAGSCDSCTGGSCCGGTQCSSVNNGACIRYVNVLKKFEYQCDVCKYKWEAVPGCGNGCKSDCGCASGAAPTYNAIPVPSTTPTPADMELPPAPPEIDAAAKSSSRNLLRYISY